MTIKFQIKDSYEKTYRTIIFFSHNHKKNEYKTHSKK